MPMTPKPKPGSLSKRSTPAPMPIKPKGMDSKAYAKRLADAKKKVAMMDPALKAKIKDMYPKTTAKSIADKALEPKTKGPAVLKGEAAAEAMRKRTSPKGVKEFEKGAKKALDKKYPGLYKKSK